MKRKVILLLFSLFVFLALPAPVFANSAEPPCLVVLVENPPEDLEITLEFDSGLSLDPLPLHRVFKAWEGYYRFYGADGVEEPEGLTGARLLVETGGEGFAGVRRRGKPVQLGPRRRAADGPAHLTRGCGFSAGQTGFRHIP